MDCFDMRKIKKFSFLCVPAKKMVNHPAEKYWNKMFFDSKMIEKLAYYTSTLESNLSESTREGQVINLKNYHECDW